MERHYVGIDFDRRRSVIVCKNEAGEVVSTKRIANGREELAAAVAAAGSKPEVILEATYGWYWAVDLLQALECNVHLASPSGLNWGQRRVRTTRGTQRPLSSAASESAGCAHPLRRTSSIRHP